MIETSIQTNHFHERLFDVWDLRHHGIHCSLIFFQNSRLEKKSALLNFVSECLSVPRVTKRNNDTGIIQHPFYRPHPKDGEGNTFTDVCPSTGGYPSPRSLVPGPFSGVPQSQLGVGGVPHSWLGYSRTGVPPGQERTGTPPSQDRTGVPPGWDRCTPSPSWDWGTSQPELGYPPAGTGVPPSPPPRQNSRVSSCYAAAVCLLQSRRKTFLFPLIFDWPFDL